VDNKVRRGGLVGPVILIGLGIVFLLNNLGVLSWSVWEVLLRMWPVLLIALGLDLLIGRRSIWGSLLALVLILAVLAGGLWLSGVHLGTGESGTGEVVSQPLEGATQARVVISQGSGIQRISALSETANLVEGKIRLANGESVTRHFAVEGGVASFALKSHGPGTVGPYLGGTGPIWDLGLNPEVPLQLSLSLGAGEYDIDLRDLRVRELDASLGAGQTTIILPQEGGFRGKVSGAVGQTVIVIPEGLAAQITMSAALVHRDVPGSFRRDGDVYTSPGYEMAEKRVELEVSQAIGQVSVRLGD